MFAFALGLANTLLDGGFITVPTKNGGIIPGDYSILSQDSTPWQREEVLASPPTYLANV